jgi:hypothetical protein
MKGSISATGIGHVRTMFRNLGRKVPDQARGQMRRASRRIVEQAQINVPEDEALLRDSIRIERTTGFRGRLQIDIVVGGQVVTNARGKQIDLDRYALLVHEAYETAVATKGPGKRTREKMLQYPQATIGSKFLERAVDKERARLQRNMTTIIDQIIEREQR